MSIISILRKRTTAASTVAIEEKLYDFSFLKNVESSDDEFIQSLKEIFIQSIPPSAKKMVKACEDGQWEQVGQIAHKLKSSIDTLNILSLKEPIRHIEECAKYKKSLNTLHAEVVKVNDILSLAVKQMQQEK
jgi:HPt (histidine-containing phosphotransfer) domain-containing protein